MINFVSDIIKDLPIFDLIPIVPALSPTCTVYYKEFNSSILKKEMFLCKTRLLKTKFTNSYFYSHYKEAVLEMQNELVAEIFKDLRNNCINEKKESINFIDDIKEENEKINDRTLRKNNMWVVTNKEIAKNLIGYDFDDLKILSKIKKIDKYEIFVDPNLKNNEILCGAKYEKDNRINGYFYCPFLWNLMKEKEKKFMIRYGKKLFSKDFYSNLIYN